MKKRIIAVCLMGAMIGVFISLMISIIISAALGDGSFHPVVPSLAEECGGELNAVIVQLLCSLLYGAAWAGASFIWKIDNWSLTRQTVTHLIICSGATFPIAYSMHWMQHTVLGAVIYFAIFIAIYFMVWLSNYIYIKKHIEEMNEKMSRQK